MFPKATKFVHGVYKSEKKEDERRCTVGWNASFLKDTKLMLEITPYRNYKYENSYTASLRIENEEIKDYAIQAHIDLVEKIIIWRCLGEISPLYMTQKNQAFWFHNDLEKIVKMCPSVEAGLCDEPNVYTERIRKEQEELERRKIEMKWNCGDYGPVLIPFMILAMITFIMKVMGFK